MNPMRDKKKKKACNCGKKYGAAAMRPYHECKCGPSVENPTTPDAYPLR